MDDFGATLEQEHDDHIIRLIVSISHAIIESECHWTPLDMGAGSIVWSIKRLRGYLWGTTFCFISDYKALESLHKIAEHYPWVQRWLESLTAYTYTLEYRKGSINGNADFLSRLPLPAIAPGVALRPAKNAFSSSTLTAYSWVDPSPSVSVWVGWRPPTQAQAWVGSRSPHTDSAISPTRAPNEG